MARQERDLPDHGKRNDEGADSSAGPNANEEILKEILAELKSVKRILDNLNKPKKRSIFDSTGTALKAPRGLS